MRPGDALLLLWFAAILISVLYVGWDAFTFNPEMKVMRYGWVLVTLYTGPVGLILYVLSCKEPSPGTHERFVQPLWKQAVGSTIHCLAGDATGIIFAAAVTGFLGFPMWLETISEYIFGFAFGLLIFQALFMKDMMGGSYAGAVRRTFLPEWISMNAMMGTMIAVMVILMTHDMAAMEPTTLRFWGIMSLATIAAGVVAFPLNAWLVWAGLKHGMGTQRALGKGGFNTLKIAKTQMARMGSHV
ncbi:MAG: DUF4396 domain-containing protein [Candidatus Eremiobacteraeota bacterium]|nr:DUF4396 domain-containing protein [Candidatus Eremiobacteraeota bacterium]